MPLYKHIVGPDGIGVDVEMTPEEEAAFLADLPPPVDPPIPPVSAAQAKLALDDAGLYPAVVAAVNAHPVAAVKIWFDNANVWERGHPYISALGLELGLTEEQIDALFYAASLK